MIEVGRVCVKLSGREAGKKCVIVEIMDNSYVLIDGDVRRKKCNVKHLEPLDKVLKLSKGADHSIVVAEFKKLGIELREKKSKEKKERPKKTRKVKAKPKKEKLEKMAKSKNK